MGPRVLLLDHDRQFVEEARASLTAMGCEVTWLAGGDAGLARAVNDRFDLVVASAELHGVNGFRLCNQVKRDPRAGAVPVFLVTTAASSQSVDAHRDLPTRADVYLRKPVVMSELLAQVRAHVRQAAPSPPAPRARAETAVGIGPSPKVPTRPEAAKAESPTLPDRPEAAKAEGPIHQLARDLSDAQREAEATASLRSHVTELQQDIAKLTRDLGEARAAATVATTRSEQLRKAGTSTVPPPSAVPTPRDAAMREMTEAKDYEILSLRSGLEAEQQASAEAWERVRVAEEARSAADVRLQILEVEASDGARNLAVARKDRDMAAWRAEDAAKRAAKLEADLKEAREQIEKERVDQAAGRAAVDEARARGDRAETMSRDRTTAAVAERERLHAEQMATMRAQHEASMAALARQAAEARAGSERSVAAMRAEADRATRALEATTRRIEELERAARNTVADDEWERTRADAPNKSDALQVDVARAREEARAARAALEERVGAAEQRLGAAEERRAREVADAKATADAANAKVEHERVAMELERNAAIADATLELRVALAKAVQERDWAAPRARAEARAELEATLRQQREADLDEATAELKIELQAVHAAAVDELRRTQIAELERLRETQTRERSETAAHVEGLERALEGARAALEGERRIRLEEHAAAAARIDALEALVATRGLEIERMRETVEATPDVAALEGQVEILQTELTWARRALEEHAKLARAADEQIERHRVLLESAREALRELLSGSEGNV